MIEPKRKFSHFSYLSGPEGMREPTGLMNLEHYNEGARRALIHTLMKNGELLASLPFAVCILNMADLRKYLEWIRRNQE